MCTTDDELDFEAMGAPTEEKPHMFRGFSLRRGSSLTREGEAWRAQGAMLTQAPESPSRKEAEVIPNSKPRRRCSVALWLLREQKTTASITRM